MDLNAAAIFMASTLLIGSGVVMVVGCGLIINNIIHRWWKPMKWAWIPDSLKQVANGSYTDDIVIKTKAK
jgi:hypothetical protein